MPKIEIELSETEMRKLKGSDATKGPIKIAILQRGWVFVGRASGGSRPAEEACENWDWLLSEPLNLTPLRETIAATERFVEDGE